MPTEGIGDEVKDGFYDHLEKTLNEYFSNDVKLIMGDKDAQR